MKGQCFLTKEFMNKSYKTFTCQYILKHNRMISLFIMALLKIACISYYLFHKALQTNCLLIEYHLHRAKKVCFDLRRTNTLRMRSLPTM